MASSGVVTYTVTEEDIIRDALEEIGILAAGDEPVPEDTILCRRKLNMILKQWGSNADLYPGLRMWLRKRAYLFLQKDQHVYSLGPSGDAAAADSYTTTTTSASALSGASTIDVASASGISSGYYIGVELSTGALQWTTVNGAPAGTTVTLTAALTADVASGARVFVYVAKPRRPEDILTAKLVDTNGDETPIDVNMGLEEYEAIPNKTVEGTPSACYYEALLTNAKLYFDREPSDVTKVARIVFLSPIENFTTSSDDANFPMEWYRPLAAQLAIDVAGSFERPVTDVLMNKRNDAVSIAQSAHVKTSNAYFQPGLD
jgi:hypothetical protein